MAKHPNVGMVYGKTLLAAEGRPLPEPSGRWRATKVWRGPSGCASAAAPTYNCISSPEVVVRSSVQRAVGGYDPACHHSSDLNMWLRIAAVADIAYVRGVPQAVYRVHSDSMLRSQASTMVDLRERRMAFDSFFASRPVHHRRVLPTLPTSIGRDRLRTDAAADDGRAHPRPPGAVAGQPRRRSRRRRTRWSRS